jgi:hypothetical protein
MSRYHSLIEKHLNTYRGRGFRLLNERVYCDFCEYSIKIDKTHIKTQLSSHLRSQKHQKNETMKGVGKMNLVSLSAGSANNSTTADLLQPALSAYLSNNLLNKSSGPVTPSSSFDKRSNDSRSKSTQRVSLNNHSDQSNDCHFSYNISPHFHEDSFGANYSDGFCPDVNSAASSQNETTLDASETGLHNVEDDDQLDDESQTENAADSTDSQLAKVQLLLNSLQNSQNISNNNNNNNNNNSGC